MICDKAQTCLWQFRTCTYTFFVWHRVPLSQQPVNNPVLKPPILSITVTILRYVFTLLLWQQWQFFCLILRRTIDFNVASFMSSLETPEATPTVHKKKISFYSVALVIQIRRSFAGGSICCWPAPDSVGIWKKIGWRGFQRFGRFVGVLRSNCHVVNAPNKSVQIRQVRGHLLWRQWFQRRRQFDLGVPLNKGIAHSAGEGDGARPRSVVGRGGGEEREGVITGDANK